MTDPVEEALAALRAGLVVAVPTDTVYGLAAVASDPAATDRIFAMKQRPADVVLPVLVASLEQARSIGSLPPGSCAARLAARWWPGALTIVVPRTAAGASLALGGDAATVGVRCPASPVVQRLAAAAGPLAVTSANLHGRPTPSTAAGVAAEFGPAVAVVVDGGVLPGAPSTVVSCVDAAGLRVLRAGAIDEQALLAVCEGAGA